MTDYSRFSFCYNLGLLQYRRRTLSIREWRINGL